MEAVLDVLDRNASSQQQRSRTRCLDPELQTLMSCFSSSVVCTNCWLRLFFSTKPALCLICNHNRLGRGQEGAKMRKEIC